MNTSRKKNLLADSAATSAPGRGQSVTELMPFMNFLVTRTLAVVTDMQHRTERSFVDEFRWVSPLHCLKNGWQTLFFLVHVARGPPFLHYYCAVVLHSCIVLPPLGHSSNHEYHCCQLTRQSSYISNFYRTVKVFIWLSLVFRFILVTGHGSAAPYTVSHHPCEEHSEELSFSKTYSCRTTWLTYRHRASSI